MKKTIFRILLFFAVFGLAVNLAGCLALKKKLTPKRKPKSKQAVFIDTQKHDIEPSGRLYQKHYVFWINWHKKFVSELGESAKSDIRSTQEMIGNLKDMARLLVDEKAELLKLHIDKLKKIKTLIDKGTMTKAREVRVRRIAEREFKAISREFSPKKISRYIREDWR